MNRVVPRSMLTGVIILLFSFSSSMSCSENRGTATQTRASLNFAKISNMLLERMDLQTYARFLFLMIHFELGNITLLKYAVENTRRFLKKRRNKLFAFESVLLKFFSQLSLAPPYQYEDKFEKLSATLFHDHSDQQRSNILDYLDFQSWINAKLLKKKR